MTDRFGLIPTDGLPNTLRGFCGQYSVRDVHGVQWMDHVHTWVDAAGDPVLTCEPYNLNAQNALAVVRDVEGLPLRLDGDAQPGLWHPAATLLIWHHNPEAPVLPAEHSLDTGEWAEVVAWPRH
jgi:hypothetical protein